LKLGRSVVTGTRVVCRPGRELDRLRNEANVELKDHGRWGTVTLIQSWEGGR
jgi:hypothetical protein